MIKHSDPKYCRAVIKKVLMRLYIGIQKQNIVLPVYYVLRGYRRSSRISNKSRSSN